MSAHLILTVSEDRYAQCVKFAEDVVHTNAAKYAQRNQSDIEKIKLDIRVGKMAEWAVYDYVRQHETKGRKIEEPDFGIYEARRKSFGADLKVDDIEIHVKSQLIEQARSFGESWSFQPEDKLTHQPTDKEFLALCLTDEPTRRVALRLLVPAKKVTELYGHPVSPKLRGKKKVLYYKDIKHLAK